MPDPRDFLPQPPWEGPPIPRVLSMSHMPNEWRYADPWIRLGFFEYVRDYEKLSRKPVTQWMVEQMWESWKSKYPEWRAG